MTAPCHPSLPFARCRARIVEALIRLDDLEDGGSARVGGDGRTDHGLMVLRRGATVFVYANRCPHVGLPLDFKPGQFLDPDRPADPCEPRPRRPASAAAAVAGPPGDSAAPAAVSWIVESIDMVMRSSRIASISASCRS